MKLSLTKILIITIICVVLLVGCNSGGANQNALTGDNHKIPYPSGIAQGGAAGLSRSADVKDSPHYAADDYYNMKSSGSMTILEKFKTYQQTAENTDGPACVVMVLEHYGLYDGFNYMELYELRENKNVVQPSLKDLIAMFESKGAFDFYSTYDLASSEAVPENLILDALKAGKPVIIGDDEWGGHWRVIIGYDTMGDSIADNDVLIVADPYDTTDHNQDGYTVASFERLFYNWHNNFDPDFEFNLFLIVTPR